MVVVAVGVDVFRVALAATDVGPHTASQTHSLLVSAGAVARAWAKLSGADGWGQRPVWVVFDASCFRVRVIEVVLGSSGGATLELAGSGTGQWWLSRKRRWWR